MFRRHHRSGTALHGLDWKVVQSDHSGHDRRQRSRNLRIRGVGLARFSVDQVAVNLSVKSILHLVHGSGKLDGCPPVADSDSMEPLAREPVRNRLNVRIGGPELRAELLRGQPLMEIRRVFRLLFRQQLLERRFLFRTSLQ